MHLCSIPFCGLLFILHLQLSTTYPIGTGSADSNLDILQELLQRLEQSVSDQTAVDEAAASEKESVDVQDLERQALGWSSEADGRRRETDEAVIRELLSPKNLKSLRNDSSRRSSGCFGRRMDRIGSMSSLGCNTVGRFNPK
ncbi:natriuretic peptides B [Mugil cephalus]|uniref:natriuretic peptides B n=1 Tax=Mugil cephalus TaxID=48193 RepID=UPI001FB7D475|nr:natriuretic peptides B [Mugil cephalus]